jgi:hypothetical protein
LVEKTEVPAEKPPTIRSRPWRPQKKYMFLYVIHLCTAFLYIAMILTSYIILSDPSSLHCLGSTVYIFQLSFCLSGNLSSQCFEPNTRHLLCSFKPSQKHPTVRHQLCEMNYVNVSPDPTALDMSCSCDIIQTFHAGRTQTLLSKSVVLPHPSMDNNLLVCAGDESTQSVCIVLELKILIYWSESTSWIYFYIVL